MKKLKIVSTIEARMNSKRLPGKVMKKINGKPMIELLYLRAIKSKLIDEIVVVTSKNKSDNILVDFLKSKKIPYFRGSENNVLKRVLMATKKFKADIIVQLGLLPSGIYFINFKFQNGLNISKKIIKR